ncbi:uncharacterized protein RCC_08417 [Ramularia collo-cygni]|uniref:Rhodopsin domain-containing protein n=1 Tax=Ramularia collo-cygni TaxID=112498 RepID=A0A2D3VCI9_9PEZI|nr:uncharacterized protein RCC_08417 [Ramularia collo-cygni]CZT22712.1 uncharacterized protein RCC_08417 [Ramularia collo-cygni]
MPRREGYVNPLAFTISLCLCFTVCVALLRVWIRRNAYGLDDAVIGVATLVSLGHTASGYAALMAGLGRPWSKILAEEDLARLNQASVASIILFFIPLYLSKCAMLSFLGRITKTPSQILLYRTCNIVVAIFGVVSIVLVTAGCPTKPQSGWYWAFSNNASSCPSQDLRWQVVTAFDIITELVLLALPVHLVWNLQMPWTKKAMIIIAFWIRLPALGFSLARNYYTLQLRHRNADAGLDGALISIWLEIELSYALAASTLSALKAFMESFDSGFGLGFTRGKGDDSYGMSNVSGSSGGQSSKTEKSKSGSPTSSGARGAPTPVLPGKKDPQTHGAAATPVPGRDNAMKLRPEQDIAYRTAISAEPFGDISLWRANSSSGSESSDDMVIHRDMAYEVQHDEAPMLPDAAHHA